jgi:hypothetical protein
MVFGQKQFRSTSLFADWLDDGEGECVVVSIAIADYIGAGAAVTPVAVDQGVKCPSQCRLHGVQREMQSPLPWLAGRRIVQSHQSHQRTALRLLLPGEKHQVHGERHFEHLT